MQRRPYNGQRETALLLGTQKEMVTENRKHRDTFTDTHRNKHTDILKYNQRPCKKRTKSKGYMTTQTNTNRSSIKAPKYRSTERLTEYASVNTFTQIVLNGYR